MSQNTDSRELVLTRDVDLPREKIWRAWTDPELMKQWFVPRPWTISKVERDLRPGGACLVVMRSPDGQEFPNPGVYLEVVPNEKLVFTDAYIRPWEPSANPFMTVVLTLDDLGGGRTRYTARAMHWTAENRQKHEEMGFFPGWNKCLDQLIELMSSH